MATSPDVLAGVRAFTTTSSVPRIFENDRTMSDRIIDEDGFDGLIARMKKQRSDSGS